MDKKPAPTPEQVEAAKAARAAYHRAYRAAHPEKVKANMMRYWLKKAKEAGICPESK